MTVKTRFAPSPTGKLHVGNARMALVNWLYARQQGGVFMLRLDDTDVARSSEAFADGIRQDLNWLGLTWDKTARQSDRFGRYKDIFEQLKASGRLYPCYETAEELDLKRKVQLSQGKPPLYDRAALKLTDSDRTRLAAEGIAPHWRFQLLAEDTGWTDMNRGDVKFHGSNLSDPILFRAGSEPVYMLASVVDDMDFAITHVIRGEDHVANTAIQIQLCEALGGIPPVYCHLPLLRGAHGEELSKRLGSLSLESLWDEGIEAMAINSLLARLGSSDPIEPYLTLREATAGFDISKFGRATAKFDRVELEHLNARILHDLPYTAVSEKIQALGLAVSETFWQAVQPNLTKLSDLQEWLDVCGDTLQPIITDPDFIRQALALLPPAPWDNTTWGAWTKALGSKTERKGKALFMPLRQALTGKDHGPDMGVLLPLIGYDRVVKRLAV